MRLVSARLARLRAAPGTRADPPRPTRSRDKATASLARAVQRLTRVRELFYLVAIRGDLGIVEDAAPAQLVLADHLAALRRDERLRGQGDLGVGREAPVAVPVHAGQQVYPLGKFFLADQTSCGRER